MGSNACACCRAVGEFFQNLSLTGCFAVLSGCGGELSGPSGSFHSPGYPNRYPSNRECIWYIHTAPGSSIQFTIQELDIQYHPNCNYDVLEVRALDLLLKNTQLPYFAVWNRYSQELQEQKKQFYCNPPFLLWLQLYSTDVITEATMLLLFFAFRPLVSMYLNQY